MRGLVWFRCNLRVHDQPALATAYEECDEIIPLFVFDDPLLQSHEFGPACLNFMLGCLGELHASLAALGLTLQWRRGFQSKKFDPDGIYLRRYVPELATVPANRIHEPHLMTGEEQRRYACQIGVDYPVPVVDHRQARQDYLALGKSRVTR